MVSKMAERVYCLYRGKDQESILMQKNACHDFAEKKGWNIVDEEQEIGVSGYKACADDRVKLQRIRKAVEQGEFDILLNANTRSSTFPVTKERRIKASARFK